MDERRAKEIAIRAEKQGRFKGRATKLWDQVDPRDFRHYTEQLTCKIEDVIRVGGLATIN